MSDQQAAAAGKPAHLVEDLQQLAAGDQLLIELAHGRRIHSTVVGHDEEGGVVVSASPLRHHLDGITWWVDPDGQLRHEGEPTSGTVVADLNATLRAIRG